MNKVLVVAAIAIFVSGVVGVNEAAAQQGPSGGNRDSNREMWSRLWNTREGTSINDDEIRQWRTQNNRIRQAIEELDDRRVDNLPLPILFGVSLSDLFPNFGDPRDGGNREHAGLDMMAADGTPVVSPTEAVVIRVGDGASSGKYVSTANPGGETFVYMHLSAVADIREGDRLSSGDLIGYVGNTGNASDGAAHLHFELRDGRTPTDPLPRLNREFSLAEKIRFLDEILDDISDANSRANFLANQYTNVFIQARLQGINLPRVIEDALPATARAVSATGAPVRDLQLGDQGIDVMALQSRLIAEGYLALSTPTDQFGPLTQAALIAYQSAKGITPASGYYGPLTRTSMGTAVSSAPATTMTRSQLISEIERLQKLIREMQR